MAGSPFLVFAWKHHLRAIENVADAMVAGLRTVGVDARTVVLPDGLDEVKELLVQPLAGVLALTTMPLTVEINGTPLHRMVNSPVWVYFLDAPIYDLARVAPARVFCTDAQTDPRLVPVSPEAGYLRLLGTVGTGGFWGSQARHLPFASFPRLPVGGQLPVPQRRICVIGTIGKELGGGTAGETLRAVLDRTAPASVAPSALDDVADLLAGAQAPAMPAEAIAKLLGWGPKELVDPEHLPLVCGVDSWVRRERRLLAVRSLIGQPVDFFGFGWQELLGEVAGFRHIGKIAHEDVALVMTRYRAVLNFDPNWAEGVHDRVYTAAAMGVPVLTPHNAALAGAGLPADLVHRYDANGPELGGLVEQLLAGRGAPAQPRMDVIVRHSWTARMAELLAG